MRVSLFEQNIWPDINEIDGGNVILGCWTKESKTAQKVVNALLKPG
jgi:hypothetical protein